MIELFKYFNSTYDITSKSETDEELNLTATFLSISIPSEADLSRALTNVNNRDSFEFSLTIGDESRSVTKLNLVKDFLDELKSLMEASDSGDSIVGKLTLHKKKQEDTISIYSFETFSSHLSSLTFSQSLAVFSRALGQSGMVHFETFDSESRIATQCISFGKGKPVHLKSIEKQSELVEQLKANTFFSELSQFTLSPQCFKLTTTKQGIDLEKLFDKLLVVFSVVYLFDQTSINDHFLDFKIKGYKTIGGKVDLKEFKPIAINEYYGIFEWVYTGGNVSDKIGLARNIISLHFEKAGELLLKGDTLGSIRSSYIVYERQNIKQYIEIRNKVSDQLTEFNERANKIIENFASGFQKSIFGLITFYTSSIIIKVFSSGKFTDVFTLDVTVLSIGFLLISVIYILVSRWEVLAQRKRLERSYTNLKTRYEDLLDRNDIKRLLNDDKEFIFHKNFIDEKLESYTWLWGATLFILFTVTISLFLKYHLQDLLN